MVETNTLYRSLPIKPDTTIPLGGSGDQELDAENVNRDEYCPAASPCATAPGQIHTEALLEILPSISEKKHPQLIYGAPLPLVCSHPVPATGELRTRPNLQVMWEHYLYDSPRGVWAEVGGAVEKNGCLTEDQGGWRNACTVRLSHMLNKAGHKIPKVKGQTVSGGSGDQYFFRLKDAQAYIEQMFGKADVDINLGPGRWFELPQVPGLLIMQFRGINFTGHATVWNGSGTVDGSDIAADRTLFWKLPCFVPEGRDHFAKDNPQSMAGTKSS